MAVANSTNTLRIIAKVRMNIADLATVEERERAPNA
jgi:hypothetical protein